MMTRILKKRTPPGPSLFSLATQDPEPPYVFQLKTLHQYGNFCKIPGFFGYYLTNSPEIAEYILKTHAQNYIKTDFVYKGIASVLGKGLLANPDNSTWLPERRLLQPLFHSDALLRSIPTIIECTKTMCQSWQRFAACGEPFNIAEETLKLLFEIIAKTLFDGDFVEHSQLLRDFSLAGNLYINKALFLYPWLPTPHALRFKKLREQAHHVILETIAHRRQHATTHPNLLSLLLAAKTETTGQPLSDTQVLDEIKTFLVTGHETTGTALAWTWYNLLTHPEIYQHFQQQAENVTTLPTTHTDLAQLRYIRMVLDESLRLHPPIWMLTRRAVATDYINDYLIPARSMMAVSNYAIHHHPDFWQNPSQFDPERFSEEQKNNRHRYCYLPFGIGPRTCIGSSLALLQAQLILTIIAQHYELELVADKKIIAQPLITLRPKKGIWVKIKRQK